MNQAITLLQFGAGNFLRAFADVFAHQSDWGKIVVVQSTGEERARLLNAQNGRYHVWVRGRENGQIVDRVEEVASIERALVARTQWPAVLDTARLPGLRAVLSNTTEAGFVLEAADRVLPPDSMAPASFPAKLLACLRARWEAGLPGLVILPCELFPGNADKLRDLVDAQAQFWGWDTGDTTFTDWLHNDCTWANTLVDRIVSGKPDSHPLLATDALLACAEPFAFWAIENKPGTEFLQHPNVLLASDIAPFSLRKVRILNGAHTGLVAYVRAHRPDILLVRDALADPPIFSWLHDLLFREILPVMANRVPDGEDFARQTLERFANPYLDHKLSDIALHHKAKMEVRLVPTRDEFVQKFGRTPPCLQEAIDASALFP